MLVKNDQKIRKIWLYLLLLSVGLEWFSIFIQRQYFLSALSLGFSFALYYFCYKKYHTWLLNLLLAFYAIAFVAFCTAITSLYMMGTVFRQTRIAEHFGFWPLCAGTISVIYLGCFLFYSYKLRKVNKRRQRGPHPY